MILGSTENKACNLLYKGILHIILKALKCASFWTLTFFKYFSAPVLAHHLSGNGKWPFLPFLKRKVPTLKPFLQKTILHADISYPCQVVVNNVAKLLLGNYFPLIFVFLVYDSFNSGELSHYSSYLLSKRLLLLFLSPTSGGGWKRSIRNIERFWLTGKTWQIPVNFSEIKNKN